MVESKKAFRTICNNGVADGVYRNACIWIAIKDYIKYILQDETITIYNLRNDAKFPGSNIDDFDFNNSSHRNGLDIMLKQKGLVIHFFYANEIDKSKKNDEPQLIKDKFGSALRGNIIWGWLGSAQQKVGDLKSKSIIPIVAFGNHFELIVSETNTTPNFDICFEKLKSDGRRIDSYQPKYSIKNTYLPIVEIRREFFGQIPVLKDEINKSIETLFNKIEEKKYLIEMTEMKTKELLNSLEILQKSMLGKMSMHTSCIEMENLLEKDYLHLVNQESSLKLIALEDTRALYQLSQINYQINININQKSNIGIKRHEIEKNIILDNKKIEEIKQQIKYINDNIATKILEINKARLDVFALMKKV
ncbi:MAG: hypothetical protein Edafosvirus15_13 [Edafosvirus sp.]|uniref:Uncharacterized protein n=1 Tax=Edafosvirus sp. TaxID=2487765 RepID=A0A3G4ZUB5_9VIRU|nr:MAG: hypothetical protein Edafosvirus15_13 [Edafosvirus sp.]